MANENRDSKRGGNMGVNIKDIVEFNSITFDDLSGKPVAFDGFNVLYQFLASVRQADGTPLMDSKGNITSHLSGLFYRNLKFLEAGIKPIFVFDGKPPKFKRMTLDSRYERKQKAEKQYEIAHGEGDIEAMRKAAVQKLRLTEEMVQESKLLLKAMGIPIVQAPSEGEAQAAYMAMNGYAYASVSQDYDSLLFGTPRLVRNLSITGKRHHVRGGIIEIKPEEIELKKLLSDLQITREQLIMLGMLVGTDYNEGITGIGPKKGLKIAKECRTLRDMVGTVRELKGYEFPEDVEEIFNFFMEPTCTEDFNLKWEDVNVQKVVELLVEDHDFTHERIISSLEKIAGSQKEGRKQSGIMDFV